MSLAPYQIGMPADCENMFWGLVGGDGLRIPVIPWTVREVGGIGIGNIAAVSRLALFDPPSTDVIETDQMFWGPVRRGRGSRLRFDFE